MVLPHALQIIHPVLQMGPEELCQQKACSHMCVLAPGPVAVCRCPAGLLLADDGLNCSTQGASAFLLMLSSSTVTQVPPPFSSFRSGTPFRKQLQFMNLCMSRSPCSPDTRLPN